MNSDGIDIVSSSNVLIADSIISTADDAICLKTLSITPLRNVLIEDCVVSGSAANGIKIGTETHGSVENVTIRNCRIGSCHGAICLYMVDGGTMSDVLADNIDIADAHSALSIRLGARNRTYAGGPPADVTGTMRRITVRGVTARGITTRHECYIAGLPDRPVEEVTLENIRIDSVAAGSPEDRRLQPELKATAYPNPITFGELPAWGLWARDVTGLALRNVDLGCHENEGRFAIVLERVRDVSLRNVVVDRVPGSLVDLRDGARVALDETPVGSTRLRLESGR